MSGIHIFSRDGRCIGLLTTACLLCGWSSMGVRISYGWSRANLLSKNIFYWWIIMHVEL